MDLYLEGIVRCEQPVSVSPPDHVDKGTRVSRLPRTTVFRDGASVKVPFVPASTFKGKLRHSVSALLFEIANEADNTKVYGPSDYQWTAQGGLYDRKKEGEESGFVDFNEIARLRENPLTSLFGAFGVSSRLSISDLVPTTPNCLVPLTPGVRANPFTRADLGEVLAEDEDYIRGMEVRLKLNKLDTERERAERTLSQVERGKIKMDPDKVKALAERKTEIETDIEALSEEAGGFVNLQQILPSQEAIAAGTELASTIHGIRLKDDEAAMIFVALMAFGLNGSRIGAKAALGRGLVSVEYDVRVRVDRERGPRRDIGRIRVSDDAGLSIVEGSSELDALWNRAGEILEGSTRFDLSDPHRNPKSAAKESAA